MALNFPLSPTLNQQYTDPNSVVWVYDGEKWGVFRTDPSKVFLGTKVSFVVPYTLLGTLTAVSFSSELFDTLDFFNPTVPNRITINRAGFYKINVQIAASSGGSGASYSVSIRKNGVFTLQSSVFAPNQAVSYQEVVQLAAGDYIQILASETTGAGQLTTASFVEISLLGYNTASQIGTYFSGAKVRLAVDEAALLAATAVNWDTADFNLNADILGSLYWSAGVPSRLSIYTTGYYNIYSLITASSIGGVNSYTITLRKNGATALDTITFSPSDTVYINSTYSLDAGEYIEIIMSNSNGTGSILAGSYFQIVRQGV